MTSTRLRIDVSAPLLVEVEAADRASMHLVTSEKRASAERTEPVMECEDNLRFMARLPDESMDLIVTSPPYNLVRYTKARLHWRGISTPKLK